MTPQRLRAVRLSLRLSHAQFAAPLGVEGSDVARWEAGLHPMPDAFVLELGAAYVELCAEAAESSRRVARPTAPVAQMAPAF